MKLRITLSTLLSTYPQLITYKVYTLLANDRYRVINGSLVSTVSKILQGCPISRASPSIIAAAFMRLHPRVPREVVDSSLTVEAGVHA